MAAGRVWDQCKRLQVSSRPDFSWSEGDHAKPPRVTHYPLVLLLLANREPSRRCLSDGGGRQSEGAAACAARCAARSGARGVGWVLVISGAEIGR